MATRQDEMIAEDVCRFANIVNDLLDVCSYVARNLDPNTGDVLRIRIPGDPPTYRAATVDDIKQKLTKYVNSVITVYYPKLLAYINALTLARIQTALDARAINAAALRADLISMHDEAIWISNQLPSVTTFAQLEAGADHIDTNVPKLPLFRRLWAL